MKHRVPNTKSPKQHLNVRRNRGGCLVPLQSRTRLCSLRREHHHYHHYHHHHHHHLLLSPPNLQSNRRPERTISLTQSPLYSSSSSSPATLLKRRRPAMLDIPISEMGFGGGVPTTPAAAVDDVEVERDGYSVYCKRGRRRAREDRYSAVVNLKGDPKQAFFGIFDGHGGAKAAEFAAENLDKNILDEVERRNEEEIEEAVKFGYLSTDSKFLKEDLHGGSCCVTALIKKGNLVVSNAGDCRAVVSRGGISEALTSDHCPSRDDEMDRIETLGDYVDCCHGVWRIHSSLAVSRGIGDRHLKRRVTAEPETKILRIESDLEFLILASDGLWVKVSNQEAIDIARPFCIGNQKPELLSACKKLAALSIWRGCTDDISVMLVQFGHFINDPGAVLSLK